MLKSRVTGLAIQGTALAVLILSTSCGSSSPTTPQPPQPGPCAYQASASGDPLPSEGGRLTVTVSTTAACSWTVRPLADWITVESNATGTGTGASTLAIGANAATTSREGSVTIETQTVRINQRGRVACTTTVSPEGERFGPDGGSRTLRVSTSNPACAWTASASETWLTVNPASGTGDADLTVTLPPYSGTTERSAALVVNDRTVTIRQDPPLRRDCEFSVSPVEFVLHWHGPGGQVTVDTQPGCRWTVRSTAAWLTFSGGDTREGAGVLTFSTDALAENATRRAPLELRWDTPTAGQNVWVNQEGCRYGMDQTPRTFSSAGGSVFQTVVTQPISPSCAQGCPWTATSDVPWIRITSTMPRAGDDAFTYVVDPNPGAGTRTGRIRLADLVLVITQTP